MLFESHDGFGFSVKQLIEEPARQSRRIPLAVNSIAYFLSEGKADSNQCGVPSFADAYDIDDCAVGSTWVAT